MALYEVRLDKPDQCRSCSSIDICCENHSYLRAFRCYLKWFTIRDTYSDQQWYYAHTYLVRIYCPASPYCTKVCSKFSIVQVIVAGIIKKNGVAMIQVAKITLHLQARCNGCDKVYTNDLEVRKFNFYIKEKPVPALSAILETALEHQRQQDEFDLAYEDSLGNKYNINFILKQ